MPKARVYITLKSGVLDPQGQAVLQALHHLDFKEVGDVRVGKYIELTLEGTQGTKVQQRITAMCEQLLANTIIESYRFDVSET